MSAENSLSKSLFYNLLILVIGSISQLFLYRGEKWGLLWRRERKELRWSFLCFVFLLHFCPIDSVGEEMNIVKSRAAIVIPFSEVYVERGIESFEFLASHQLPRQYLLFPFPFATHDIGNTPVEDLSVASWRRCCKGEMPPASQRKDHIQPWHLETSAPRMPYQVS